MAREIEKITVIGAGTMGSGIAQVAALAGLTTTLFDLDQSALEGALGKIRASLDKGLQRGKLTEADRDGALSRLTLVADFSESLDGANLVIEAVVEDLDVKRRLFAEIAERVRVDAVLASNTSSLSLARIADAVPHPERVVGMHFFNPVPVMKLLEVVVHAATSDETRRSVLDLGRRLGKEPIVVNDSPGFASSRLGVVLGLEAIRMVEQGVASAEDIDKAMELGYRHPMGPLRLTDLVGLDVRLAIAEFMHAELKSDQYLAPDLLRKKVARGELGQKSGQGFYEWPR